MLSLTSSANYEALYSVISSSSSEGLKLRKALKTAQCEFLKLKYCQLKMLFQLFKIFLMERFPVRISVSWSENTVGVQQKRKDKAVTACQQLATC